MLEKEIQEMGRSKGAREEGDEVVEAEAKKMAVSALVAMIEIWMSDLWYVSLSSTCSRFKPRC